MKNSNILGFSKVRALISRCRHGRTSVDIGGRRNTILVVGAGRSGTTWLGDVVAGIYRYRQIFEPFWHLHLEADGLKEQPLEAKGTTAQAHPETKEMLVRNRSGVTSHWRSAMDRSQIQAVEMIVDIFGLSDFVSEVDNIIDRSSEPVPS